LTARVYPHEMPVQADREEDFPGAFTCARPTSCQKRFIGSFDGLST